MQHGSTATARHAPKPAVHQGGKDSVVWALLSIILAFFGAAILDFETTAGMGVTAGLLMVGTAPWVLWIRSRVSKQEVLAGAMSVGWVLLLVGNIPEIIPHGEFEMSVKQALSALVSALGALAVLLRLWSLGHLSGGACFFRITVGLILGGGLVAFRLLMPAGELVAASVSTVLTSTFLLPQLFHDLLVVIAASRGKGWAWAQGWLSAVGMPFILWSLAGHLIFAPSILYWSPKPEVFFGGFGTAILLALFAVRGLAGVFSPRAALVLISAACIYGVGLAFLVQGNRFYFKNEAPVEEVDEGLVPSSTRSRLEILGDDGLRLAIVKPYLNPRSSA